MIGRVSFSVQNYTKFGFSWTDPMKAKASTVFFYFSDTCVLFSII